MQLDGILFMEGSGEPTEIVRLNATSGSCRMTPRRRVSRLEAAMEASWAAAASLLDIRELADVLGERHRIIANDWQAALLSSLVAQLLRRAVEILDRVEFDPVSLRKDLAGDNVSARLLYGAAEIVGHAADVLSDSAGLDADNERRWRVFRGRVRELVASNAAPVGVDVVASQ